MTHKIFILCLSGISLLSMLVFASVSYAPDGLSFGVAAMTISGVGVLFFGIAAAALHTLPANHWVHGSKLVYFAILAFTGMMTLALTFAG